MSLQQDVPVTRLRIIHLAIANISCKTGLNMSPRVPHSLRGIDTLCNTVHQACAWTEGLPNPQLLIALGRIVIASLAVPRPEATQLASWRRAYNDNVVGSCGCGEGTVDERLLR